MKSISTTSGSKLIELSAIHKGVNLEHNLHQMKLGTNRGFMKEL
ncbi:MAG: hypothetical protein ACFFA0_07310 [Promethearchaeota archaeon]